MIGNERLTAYIHSLERGDGGLLGRIAKEAAASSVPIIKRRRRPS